MFKERIASDFTLKMEATNSSEKLITACKAIHYHTTVRTSDQNCNCKMVASDAKYNYGTIEIKPMTVTL